MSQLYNKLQLQKTIDLIWDREVKLIEKKLDDISENQSVDLTREIQKSKFIPDKFYD